MWIPPQREQRKGPGICRSPGVRCLLGQVSIHQLHHRLTRVITLLGYYRMLTPAQQKDALLVFHALSKDAQPTEDSK